MFRTKYQGEAKVREPIDKTWVLTLIQGLEKTHFWTSFSAFPNQVVLDIFVARELPDKTHFSDFFGKKFFSMSLTIFRFRFNVQSTQVLSIGSRTFAPPPDIHSCSNKMNVFRIIVSYVLNLITFKFVDF